MSNLGVPMQSVDHMISKKRLRKGTRSCVGCRRRKIRCIPRSGNSTSCVECFSRGVQCIDQAVSDPSMIPEDNRTNLRERMAQVEEQLQELLAERETLRLLPITDPDEHDIPATGLDVYGDIKVDLPDRIASLSHDQPSPAPLLSALRGLTADTSQSPINSNEMHSPGNTASPPDLYRPGAEQAQTQPTPKQVEVRKRILSFFPPPKEEMQILVHGSAWWQFWRHMHPELGLRSIDQGLMNYITWCKGQADCVAVATGLLTLLMCARQYPIDNTENSQRLLTYISMDTMKVHMTNIERLIVFDNEFAMTNQGLRLGVLQTKMYINLGQPRRGWLIIRRVIALSQLMGIKPGIGDDSEAQKIYDRTWWQIYKVDRMCSLLLGLPPGLPESPQMFGDTSSGPTSTNLEIFTRKLSQLNGIVTERNISSEPPSLHETLKLDDDLEAYASAMPTSWWSLSTVPLTQLTPTMAVHSWHSQLKSLIHLPFMLRSTSDPKYYYNRVSCISAARNQIKLYHLLRQHSSDNTRMFLLSRIFDFQALTASVILLLGLMGYGTGGQAQADEDWHLVSTTMQILRRAVATEDTDPVIAQALHILEVLTSAHYGEHAGPKFSVEKILVPYFGTIKISPPTQPLPQKQTQDVQEMHTTPSHQQQQQHPHRQRQHQQAQSIYTTQQQPQEQYITPSSEQQVVSGDGEGMNNPDFAFSIPDLDIDWQSTMNMNMDMTQEWGWMMTDDLVL